MLVEKFVESLKRNNVELITEIPENAYVTEAVSAAADTGLIFFAGYDEAKKSALADHHVAIVRKEVIRETIIEAYALASKHKYIFASSSASKTADIGGKLVWGMHGPRKFSVVIK